MNSINVNIPVVNMPSVTQHQTDMHRAPIAHQVQNAEIARDKLDLQTRVAQEAKEVEDKVIDPNDHKEGGREQKKKKQDEEKENEKSENDVFTTEVKMTDSGRLIDLEA